MEYPYFFGRDDRTIQLNNWDDHHPLYPVEMVAGELLSSSDGIVQTLPMVAQTLRNLSSTLRASINRAIHHEAAAIVQRSGPVANHMRLTARANALLTGDDVDQAMERCEAIIDAKSPAFEAVWDSEFKLFGTWLGYVDRGISDFRRYNYVPAPSFDIPDPYLKVTLSDGSVAEVSFEKGEAQKFAFLTQLTAPGGCSAIWTWVFAWEEERVKGPLRQVSVHWRDIVLYDALEGIRYNTQLHGYLHAYPLDELAQHLLTHLGIQPHAQGSAETFRHALCEARFHQLLPERVLEGFLTRSLGRDIHPDPSFPYQEWWETDATGQLHLHFSWDIPGTDVRMRSDPEDSKKLCFFQKEYHKGWLNWNPIAVEFTPESWPFLTHEVLSNRSAFMAAVKERLEQKAALAATEG